MPDPPPGVPIDAMDSVRARCIDEARAEVRAREYSRDVIGAYDLESLASKRVSWLETSRLLFEHALWYAPGDPTFEHRDKQWSVLHLPRDVDADRSEFFDVLRRGIELMRVLSGDEGSSSHLKLKLSGLNFVGLCDLSEWLPPNAEVAFHECTFERLLCSSPLMLHGIEFHRCGIDELADLCGLAVRKGVVFDDCCFRCPAVFRGLNISGGSLRFQSVDFLGGVLLHGCSVSGSLEFERCVVGDAERTGADISFAVEACDIGGDVQFGRSIAIGPVMVTGTSFGGALCLQDSNFFGRLACQSISRGETLTFDGCGFFELVSLRDMSPIRTFTTRDSCFHDRLEVAVDRIDRLVSQRCLHIGEWILDSPARADVQTLSFADSFFWSNVEMSGVNFMRPLSVARCVFFASFAMAGSTVSGGIEFEHCNFLAFRRRKIGRLERTRRFRGCFKLLHGLPQAARGAAFDAMKANVGSVAQRADEGTEALRASIDFERMATDFRTLRVIAQSRLNSRDMCSFYVLESEAHIRALAAGAGGAALAQLDPEHHRIGRLERFVQWLALHVFGIVSRYGTSVWRPIFWLLVVQCGIVAGLSFMMPLDHAVSGAVALITPPLGLDVSEQAITSLVAVDPDITVMIALDRILTLVLVVLAILALKRRMQLS